MDELYEYVTALFAVLGIGGYLLYPEFSSLFKSDKPVQDKLAKRIADASSGAHISGPENEEDDENEDDDRYLKHMTHTLTIDTAKQGSHLDDHAMWRYFMDSLIRVHKSSWDETMIDY